MIYDVFCFFNEVDVLEERLNYLYDEIDYFVLCESNVTHVGVPKVSHYFNNISRYKKYVSKIIYLNFQGALNCDNPWINENCQRNFILSQLQLSFNDKIIISDVDEIPSKHFVRRLVDYSGDCLLISIQEFSFFKPNCRRSDIPYWIGGSRGFNFKYLNVLKYLNHNYSNTFLSEFNDFNSLTKIRLTNIGIPILNGGWHLSYMGGERNVAQKLLAFAHTEEVSRIGINVDLVIQKFFVTQVNFFGENEVYYRYGTFDNKFLSDCDFFKHKLTWRIKLIWIFKKYWLVLKVRIKFGLSCVSNEF